jgi:TrmH family RNA methyltransferase
MALSKAQIKFLQSLKVKKYRQRYNKFAVEGEKIAAELLSSLPQKVEAIYALAEWIQSNEKLLSTAGRPVEAVSEEELRKISSFQTPNKVYVLAATDPAQPLAERVENGLSFFLDGIQDPGNLGTILRIADWFGLAAVFCAPHCVEWANPKVVQASMGSFFRTPLEYLSFEDLLQRHPGLPVWGASMEGQSLYQAPLTARALVVIGSESHGISPEVAGKIHGWIGIPRQEGSAGESLNAAVASAIICAVIRGRSEGMPPIAG